MRSLAPLLDAVPASDGFTLDDAVLVAAVAHHGQRDKGRPSQPYLSHPLRVAAAFDDEVHQMIAVLHDAVEDSGGRVTTDLLRNLGAPGVIVDAVEALTHRDREPRSEYLGRVKANPDALEVKRADNRDNSHEARLALLPPVEADRLRRKYQEDRSFLGFEA
jgi:(p)ppGpp synthase/HD superfamily hydrolase